MAAAAAAGTALTASAAPIQWDGQAGDLKWDNATNWASSNTKPGIADIAVFVSTGLASGDTIDTGAAGQSVGQIRFGPTAASAADFTQDLTLAGGAITLYGVENNNGLRIGIQRTDKAGGVNAVNSPLTLANDVFFQVAALNDGGRLVINGAIGETGGVARGITKLGGQVLELNGNNTFTGVPTVRQNNVVIGHANALGLGTSAVVVGNTDATTNNAAGLLTKSGVTFGRDVVVVDGATGARRLGGVEGQTASLWTGNVFLNRATNFTAGTNTPGGVVEFSGAIADGTSPGPSGATVTKVEEGTVKFSGANTYSGPTNVNAGTLVVNGSLSDGTGAVTVASGARLGGDGVIARPVTLAAGATIAPGDGGTGTFTLGGGHVLTFGDGAALEWELGASPSSSDLLSVAAVDFQGSPLARLLGNGNDPLPGTPYVLLEWSGADPGVLPPWTFDPASTLGGQIEYVGAADGQFGGRVEFTALPEPASAGLLAVAGTALLGRRRRR